MIFYATVYTGQSGDITNHFTVRKDEAVKAAKEAAERPSTVDARAVKLTVNGHHAFCELLNVASGSVISHFDDESCEVVWSSGRQRRTRKSDEEEMLS